MSARRAHPHLTPFERHYTELGDKLIPERKRIDFVLVHKVANPESLQKDQKEQHVVVLRSKFENVCVEEGLLMQKDTIGDFVYTKLHCPFKRLCCEAEAMGLEMPLKGCEKYPEDSKCSCIRNIYQKLRTDDTLDFVSASFQMDKIHFYQNHDDPSNFFRPALRSLLTHRILINADVTDKSKILDGDCCPKKGLSHMLLRKVYCDYFSLHDESLSDPIDKNSSSKSTSYHNDPSYKPGDHSNGLPVNKNQEPNESRLETDARKDLNETWTVFYKFQPLWKIRDYFGEKIALYFAWTGALITYLWLPTIFGICIFFYGLSTSTLPPASGNTTVISRVKSALTVVKNSFDNEVTPYFALFICIWGTFFMEMWKRKTAKLAYEWDVDLFEDFEPDRPQFIGTDVKPDPVTKEMTWFYPVKRQFLKFSISASILILMICMVFISVFAVILYRVIVTVDFCPTVPPSQCTFTTVVLSSLLNGVSILLLGKLYDYLAYKLTEWENHRTQTAFDDALIIKLFAFQFANSYSSCFYIAFFRGSSIASKGILNLGNEYVDKCPDDNCMAQLSIQVLILMLLKPFPKFLKDIIIPFLIKLWNKRPKWCCRKKIDCKDRVEDGCQAFHEYLERERRKPQLGDFTLGEYTEKVIQYGYLMLFAASFPLGPLLALLTNLFDIRVDAKRLLWWNRRPIAYIAEDIGMWYGILMFLNIGGVVTNAFLIAFTSSFGQKYSLVNKLWIVIAFEHIVFALKFFLEYVISDVPKSVILSKRREHYQLSKTVNVGKKLDYSDLVNLVPTDESSRRRTPRRLSSIVPEEPVKHPVPAPLPQ